MLLKFKHTNVALQKIIFDFGINSIQLSCSEVLYNQNAGMTGAKHDINPNIIINTSLLRSSNKLSCFSTLLTPIQLHLYICGYLQLHFCDSFVYTTNFKLLHMRLFLNNTVISTYFLKQLKEKPVVEENCSVFEI